MHVRKQHRQECCCKFCTVDCSSFVWMTDLFCLMFLWMEETFTAWNSVLKVNQHHNELQRKASRSLLVHGIINESLYSVQVKNGWKFSPVCLFKTGTLPLSLSVTNVSQPNSITESLFICFDLLLDSRILIKRKHTGSDGITSLSKIYVAKVSHCSCILCHFPHQERITDNYSTRFLLLQTQRYFIWYRSKTPCQSNTLQCLNCSFSKSSCLSDIQLWWCQNCQEVSITKRLCLKSVFVCKLAALHKQAQNRCLNSFHMSPLWSIHF